MPPRSRHQGSSHEDSGTPVLSPDEASQRFASARVARLATTGPKGPHIVPITFVSQAVGLCTVVDAKPKRSRDLARLRNIASDPAVSVLVDEYDEDWAKLWWARADGEARIIDAGPEFDTAVGALVAKYPQYRDQAPAGPVIVIEVHRWSGWTAN